MDYDVAAAFARTDLFGTLDRKALNRLAAAARVVKHPAGKAIIDEGGTGVGFHLILDGTARVRVGDQARASLGSGDYFGEISMVDGKPRSASVSAETDLTTASLTHWTAKPLLKEQTEVTLALLRHVCALLRATEGDAGS